MKGNHKEFLNSVLNILKSKFDVSTAKVANIIGETESKLSRMRSGRTQPKQLILDKIKKHFPEAYEIAISSTKSETNPDRETIEAYKKALELERENAALKLEIAELKRQVAEKELKNKIKKLEREKQPNGDPADH